MRFPLLALAGAATVHGFEHGRRQDGQLPYLDAALSLDERVDDLMSRLSLEEKAGQMFHARTSVVNGTFDSTIQSYVVDKHITHYVLSGGVNDARVVAEWYNALQGIALGTPSGIPITISSDPQHGWVDDAAVSNVGQAFSRWTESLGLAALRDPQLVRKFAEIAREEYLSVGIRQALHPQVDLGTEPRWGRFGGTMGEDADLTSELVVEYIKGFQGDSIGSRSVIATTKHFPGGGPMENGEDSHFPWVSRSRQTSSRMLCSLTTARVKTKPIRETRRGIISSPLRRRSPRARGK
jgi:beta-glucosidase